MNKLNAFTHINNIQSIDLQVNKSQELTQFSLKFICIMGLSGK